MTVERLLPGAAVVKAFNTIFADVMIPEHIVRGGLRVTAVIAGDNERPTRSSRVGKVGDPIVDEARRSSSPLHVIGTQAIGATIPRRTPLQLNRYAAIFVNDTLKPYA